MKNFVEDFRDGGPHSDRATDSQLKRLEELKIRPERVITWLEAKRILKSYHQNKGKK